MIMTDRRFMDIPLILETPVVGDDFSIWQQEIQLLRRFENKIITWSSMLLNAILAVGNS